MPAQRVSFALTAVAALALAAPAFAQGQIGRAAAVVPHATGAPPQQPPRVLQVGVDMFQNERVETGPEGRAQLLFVDGTALTVGPNSDVVLDEYVFDPSAGTGNIALSATRGVFRVVGGKISKGSPVTIRTPTVTIGVRGGVALLNVGETVSAGFIYGEEMTVTGGGRTERTRRPGTEIVTPPDGTPNPPQPLSETTISNSLDATEGEPGQQTGPAVSNEDVAQTQVAALSSDIAPDVVNPGDLVPPPVDVGAFEEEAGLSDAAQNEQSDRAQETVGGGGAVGMLVGRYKTSAISGTDEGTGDDVSAFNIPFTGAAISGGQFTVSLGFNQLTFPVNPNSAGSFSFGSSNVTDSPFGPLTGIGWISPERDFGFIEFLEDDFPGFRGVAFFGLPTPASAFPTSGVTAYDLRPDFVLGGSNVPFLPANLGGSLVNSPSRAFINWSGDGAKALLAAKVVVTGAGPGQLIAGSLITGRVVTDGAQPHAFGEMGGVFADGAALPPYLFDGSVSTSDAGDGSDFFGLGGPGYFVLEASGRDSSDAATSALGISVERDGVPVRVIYPNSIASALPEAPSAVRTSGALILETAGITRDTTSGPGTLRRFTTNDNAPGTLTLDASTGSLQASIRIASAEADVGGFGTAELLFGAAGATPISAFINDRNFAAFAPNAGSTVNGAAVLAHEGAIVATEQMTLSGVFPTGVQPCDCAYVRQGLLFSDFTPTSGTTHYMVAAPFAAGPPVSPGQFPSSGSATYSGAAWANVAVLSSGALYLAGGSFSATATFSPGLVDLTATISNLDGATLTFLGEASAPGPIFMEGSGSHPTFGPLDVVAKAQFAGPGTPPEETFGYFIAEDMGNSAYRQAGTFAGKR